MDARSLLYRFVLVKVRPGVFKGSQPRIVNGFWEGLISEIGPKVDESGKVVDHVLVTKLWCGTSQNERFFEILFSDPGWKLRYPSKGEHR